MPVIGVALAIPEPWATQLQNYRTGIDPGAALIPTHITLIPPTSVTDGDLAEVEGHLAAVAQEIPPYDVHLRGTGTFRPVSPVVFVSLVEGISQTERLAQAVCSGPFDVKVEFPYHPHVTIAHHLADGLLDQAFGDLADFEAAFAVDGFHLYVHDEDAGWRPTRGFPLQGAGRSG